MAKKSPNPIDKHVGARVRMRRMMLDKSQTALGEAIGLTFQQVQKYEKGTNRISPSRMMEIANFLGVAPAFFYEGAQRMPTSTRDTIAADVEFADLQQFLATADGVALMKAFPAIKNGGLCRRLIALMQALGETVEGWRWPSSLRVTGQVGHERRGYAGADHRGRELWISGHVPPFKVSFSMKGVC